MRAGRGALERIDHDQQLPSGCRWSARRSTAARRRPCRARSPGSRPSPRRRRSGRPWRGRATCSRCLTTSCAKLRIGIAGEHHQAVVGHGGVAWLSRRSVFTAAAAEIWLGRKDSNLRMPESKSGALTNLATPQVRVRLRESIDPVAERVPLQPPRDEPAHRAAAVPPSVARASACEANSANTQAPDPVMRACGQRPLQPREMRRHLGASAATRPAPGRLRPCPGEKGRYFERFRISCQFRIGENVARGHAAPAAPGPGTTPGAAQAALRRSPMPSPSALRPNTNTGTSAPSSSPSACSRSRAQARAPQAVEREQRGGGVRAAAAEPAARSAGACRARCRRRAASPLRALQQARRAHAQVGLRGHAGQRIVAPDLAVRRTAMPTRSPASMSRNTVCSRW